MLADAELFGSLSEIAGSEGIEWIEKRWVGVGLLTRIQPRYFGPQSCGSSYWVVDPPP